MNTAGKAVAKGIKVHSVHAILKGVKWTNNLTALEAAEGRYLTLMHCHNARAEWKKSYPD